MNTKVDEGKLISGKEALTKVTEGIVQYKCDEDPVADRWTTITDHFWDQYNLGVFLNENTTWKFRLKPRTISINGIEAPGIKKESAIYRSNDTVAIVCESFEEAELMCLALRQVFGGSHDN